MNQDQSWLAGNKTGKRATRVYQEVSSHSDSLVGYLCATCAVIPSLIITVKEECFIMQGEYQSVCYIDLNDTYAMQDV